MGPWPPFAATPIGIGRVDIMIIGEPRTVLPTGVGAPFLRPGLGSCGAGIRRPYSLQMPNAFPRNETGVGTLASASCGSWGRIAYRAALVRLLPRPLANAEKEGAYFGLLNPEEETESLKNFNKQRKEKHTHTHTRA